MIQNDFFKIITLMAFMLWGGVNAFGQITWTGQGNIIKWNDGANWQGGSAPTASDDVIIPSLADPTKYPQPIDYVYYSPVTITVNSITLEDGALILHNDGLGSMTINGTINYKRNLATTNWYLMSSPVVGETVQNLITNHTFATNVSSKLGIGTYNNATTPNTWTYATTTSSGILKPGDAKSIKLASSGNMTFTGTFNNSSSVKVALTQGVTGFNLVGNPFIAPINANNGSASGTELLDTNTTILDEATIWLWNQAANSGAGAYEVINNATPTTSIGVAQGFFVKLKAGTASADFEFTSGMQGLVLGVGNPFQRQVRPKINLTVTQKDAVKNTDIYYIDGATTSFDNGYDSSVFGAASSNLEIFTQLISNNQGKNLAIQSLPNDNFDNVIPIGLIAKAGEEITFKANSTNLPTGIDVYLEDRTNNVFTKISEENYKITLNTDANSIGQFYLHTSSKPLSIGDNKQELANVSIYLSNSNELTITGLQTEKTTINVYSVLGKQVFTNTITSNGVSKVNLPSLNTGVYIVNITSESGKISRKIVLK